MINTLRLFAWLFLGLAALTSENLHAQVDTLPLSRNDGWKSSTLTTEQVASKPFEKLLHDMEKGLFNKTEGILVVKNNRLVFERYFPGRQFNGYRNGRKINYGIDTLHNLASITKTVTSILMGIAIDKGLVSSEDDCYLKYMPEYLSICGKGQDSVAIRYLLMMQSGIAWDEWTFPYNDKRNDIIQLFHQKDPLAYIVKKPIIKNPGTEFTYNGGNYNILGHIIEKASGMSIDKFSKQYLFAPMGIDTAIWQKLPSGHSYTSGDMLLKPRDMAKLGYLYLNQGRWQDRQLISQNWIDKSTKNYNTKGNIPYGYGWWLQKFSYDTVEVETFNALGWGGQVICVIPSLTAVIVLTGGYYSDANDAWEKIIPDYIIPALLRIPTPIPLVPIQDTVPKVTMFLHKVATDMANGIFTPQNFTADFGQKFTNADIKNCSIALKKIGNLDKLVLLQCRNRKGLKYYQYLATYKKWIFFTQNLMLKAEINQDGKIASISITSE